jgi:hypothetical protein
MPQYAQVMTAERAAKLYGIEVIPQGPTSPPVNIDVPHVSLVSGTGVPGDTLTCTMGNWDHVPDTYAYRWARNGTPIIGAPGAAVPYVISSSDVSGSELTCVVSATNAMGTTTAPPSNAFVIP